MRIACRDVLYQWQSQGNSSKCNTCNMSTVMPPRPSRQSRSGGFCTQSTRHAEHSALESPGSTATYRATLLAASRRQNHSDWWISKDTPLIVTILYGSRADARHVGAVSILDLNRLSTDIHGKSNMEELEHCPESRTALLQYRALLWHVDRSSMHW